MKGVAAGLGVAEPVTSPTFNILLVHPGRLPLYHFDLYRLERAEQLEDIDFYGTLEAGGVSRRSSGATGSPTALPDDRLAVRIAHHRRRRRASSRSRRSRAALAQALARRVGRRVRAEGARR